ncbi:MAG: transcription-repair coupling factor [Pirellulaceae bacterium]
MDSTESTTTPLTQTQDLVVLSDRVLALPDFSSVVQALESSNVATIDGMWGSSQALAVAALAKRRDKRPIVIVLPTMAHCDDFIDDFSLFSHERLDAFPALQVAKGERVLMDENAGDRLRILKSLAHHTASPLIVTSIQSLLQPCPSAQTLAENSRSLAVGERRSADEIARWLAEHRYHATSAVELPGEFSLRGGILDIFANDWLHPVRIEFFDDEIDSIREFDIETQRSIQTLDRIEVTVMAAVSAAGTTDSFVSHVPSSAWFVLVELDELQKEAKAFLERSEPEADCLSLPVILQGIQSHGHLHLASLATGHEGTSIRLGIESVERFSGEINKVRDELDSAAGNFDVYMVAETEAEIQRLHEILAETKTVRDGRLAFVEGRLTHGFRLVDSNTLVVSGNELFHRMHLRRMAKRRPGKAIDSFLDLREGDLVVHLAHGIARYRGLKLLQKEGQVEEHLELEFHGGTKIYVPAARIEMVQKYVGGRKARPKLATIGGKLWQKQKKAAELSVQDLAEELLEVQAKRASRSGIAFRNETEWQREFDAAFPYTETADQLTAIDAVADDMAAPRPMDRLICGDVGFGKTEIAMRAAFRAVDHGYQVAVLVPTTILAEQHYRTFKERMAEFPFSIGKLSRFCTTAEQRETIKLLKAGAVDIVIGTHRLASKDVKFHNLGLLVIDEEQRFGVEVKERLKKLKNSVDVLTLSATPIPRTLHLSLTGIRDISNLETPPEDRVPVETKVTRWSDSLIRNALLRELNRGGQAYFVHNRVNDIEKLAFRLNHIVPEAKIGIGHGQMAEGELEKVMVQFVNHEFDVLLATTIVESGLDIPNANTIFVDEADRYGLADLHQLRGRVGRYKHRAFCYLLIDSNKSLTPNAARRLRAIEEFSDMGAGFAISMRDLEIRGAGNILGTQQSGHIALVGYELYCQLLDAAVRRLKNLPAELSLDVNLELPGEAYLPKDYVPDMRTKIDLYRRIARSAGDAALDELREELVDRFGPIPEPVDRMFRFASLKADAAIWQIDTIFIEDNYLVFRYRDAGRAKQLARNSGGRLRVVDHASIYHTLPAGLCDPDQLIELVKSLLQL